MKQQLYLICDCWGQTSMQLVENKKTRRDGRIVFYGPFTETDRENRNRRIYPDDVMRPEFNRLSKLASEGRLSGEADHPSDSIVHTQAISHRITRLWWDDHRPNVGWCECVTTNTPNGMVIEGLLTDGVPLGISSRGVGSGSVDRDGRLIISDGFRAITGDVVADPSYQEAWMSMKESVGNDIATGRKRFSLNGIKIENSAVPVVKVNIDEAIANNTLPITSGTPQGDVAPATSLLSLEEVMLLAASKAAKLIRPDLKK